jgi:non-heme chloroperoxidase
MPLVNIGDLRLNVTMHGGSGRTLVFVHGNLASADWLELCLPHLSASFRVVCVEWRGCGLSDRPPPTPDFANYSPRQHAKDILQALVALGIDDCDLIGHSTGGIIGNYLVCDDPQRFRRVVCLDPVPPQSLPFDEQARAFFAAAQRYPALARWAMATAVSSLFEPSSLTKPGEPVFRAGVSAAQRALFDRVARQASAASHGVWLGTPTTLDRLRARNDLVPRLAGVAQPHLIIQGREDRIIPLAEVVTMTSLVPDAELRILEGIGHSATIEAPDAFCALAVAFLLA